MKKGDVTPMFLPSGKFVTRWKEDDPSANTAIVTSSEADAKETLASKFDQKPDMLSKIGLFQFLGWADDQELQPAVRGMRPEPLVTFAKVLTTAQIRERLTEIVSMVERAGDTQEWYVEVFVRSRDVSDRSGAPRHRRRGRDGQRSSETKGRHP